MEFFPSRCRFKPENPKIKKAWYECKNYSLDSSVCAKDLEYSKMVA